jgi:hypothetical protein
MTLGNGEPSDAWFAINKYNVQKKLKQCQSNSKDVVLSKGDTLFSSIKCSILDTVIFIDRTSK